MSKRKQQQISFDSLDSAVAQTLKHYVPAVEFAWDTYAPHEQSAFVEWARRIDAGEQAGRWSDALAAANATHRSSRPIPDKITPITPNTDGEPEIIDWAQKDPQLHAAIESANHKQRRHRRDDGYVVIDSVVVPHVWVRGTRDKDGEILQQFGLQHKAGHLGPREFTVMATLLSLCVERCEGNVLQTYPMELRINMRRTYNNSDINDSMWQAIEKLKTAGYLTEAKVLSCKRWRVTFDRDLLLSWLRDEIEDHAYQCIDAEAFYERARTPTKQWLYCAYETDYPYSGEDDTTVRDASGSSAKRTNFRRAVRKVFRRCLSEAVDKQQQEQETAVEEQTVKTEILSEVKRLIKKTVLCVWIRGRVINSGYLWKFDAAFWKHAIANIGDLIAQAVDTVAARLLGGAEPIPAD